MKNGGVKIKIRRELLSPESIYKHQNYSTVLKRHERHKRFRRALKFFIYSVFAAVLVILLVFGALFIYKQIQQKNAKVTSSESTGSDQGSRR